MKLEIVLSDHSEMRIKQRMMLSSEEVLVRLQKQIYDEVKTVEGDGFTETYVVLWDNIALRPFLLILVTSEGLTTLRTTYETYENHFRRDGAVVRLSHIFVSRRKCYSYLAYVEAKRLKKLAEDELSKVVHLDIKATLFRGRGRHKTKEFKKIVSVPLEDYQERLESNPVLLLNDAMAEMVKQEVEYPEGVQFLFEVYHSRPSGRVVLYKGMI